MNKIEERCPEEDSEPVFTDWIGNPWTEAEKVEMQRKYPDCDFFLKCLTDAIPYEELVRRKESDTPLGAPWDPFHAGHITPEFRKRLRRTGWIP
jgi:hypothetical protein